MTRVWKGLAVLAVVLTALVWSRLNAERAVEFQVINTTGQDASDLKFTFARKTEVRFLDGKDDLATGMDLSAAKRHATLAHLSTGESRRFSIPEPALFWVRVNYKDRTGRAKVAFGNYSLDHSGRTHRSLATIWLYQRYYGWGENRELNTSPAIRDYVEDTVTLLRRRYGF